MFAGTSPLEPVPPETQGYAYTTHSSISGLFTHGGREVWGQPQGDLLHVNGCEIRFARAEILLRSPLDAGKVV